MQGTVGKMPGYKVRETLVLKALHRHGTDMVCMHGRGNTILSILTLYFSLIKIKKGAFFCKKST